MTKSVTEKVLSLSVIEKIRSLYDRKIYSQIRSLIRSLISVINSATDSVTDFDH